MSQKILTGDALMNNIINACMSEIMKSDFDIIDRKKTELAELSAREKGISGGYRGYQFMGAVHHCKKFGHVPVSSAQVVYPPLEPPHWGAAREISVQETDAFNERDQLKMRLYKHFSRVSPDDGHKWLSSIPGVLLDKIKSMYTNFRQEWDYEAYKPSGHEYEEWRSLMDLIYMKMTMRLIV